MREQMRRRSSARGIRALAYDTDVEARAQAMLDANRGRPPIKAAPSAGKIAAAILRPLLPARSLSLAELQRAWREIVGESVAKAAFPEKLSAGVLTLKVPSALAPFLQHQAPLVLERCRLAGAAIKSVKIEQGQLPRPAAPKQPALSAAEEASLADRLKHITDDGLRAALLRLGKAMATR